MGSGLPGQGTGKEIEYLGQRLQHVQRPWGGKSIAYLRKQKASMIKAWRGGGTCYEMKMERKIGLRSYKSFATLAAQLNQE